VLACSFERAFLDVPQECLILTMKANQKYFPLLEPGGRLSNRFLVVANIRPDDAARIVEGNERVVRPRLADAKFFFDQDRRKTLASRLPGLDRVVYHNKLGSQGERSARVVALARAVAERLAAALGAPELPALAERAALLAKADLLTDMVGEFPELQGTMGRYYALADGEPAAVAEAIEHHYRPRFAGDELPASPPGLALALADKLETLAGLFSIGERPSGDRDPFALRRHALGVLRMLIERDLPLELPWLIERALAPFAASAAAAAPPSDIAAQLQAFFDDRLVAMLREQQWTAHEVDAVVAVRPPRLGDVPLRLRAVRAFAALPEAQALAAANKRIGNILKKSEEAPAAAAAGVDAALLQAPAEQALAAALGEVAPQAEALHAGRDYTAALRVLAQLRPQVDAFFDQVMVNTDDAALRRNRLALLAALQRTMNRSAELARLAAG
jgi:glycyl-tRNA synthetase beta chain